MDAAVAWLQEEQLGPAKDTWINIWETNNEIHQLEQQQQQQTMAVTNPNSNNSSLEANTNTTANKTTTNNSNKTNSDAGTIMQSQPLVPSSSPPIDTAVATKTTSTAAQEDTTPVVSANGPGHVPQQPHHHPQGQNGNPMLDRAYNPTRRKLPEKYENKASTYNMNKYQQKLIRKYNGCPWRQKNKKYSPGILG